LPKLHKNYFDRCFAEFNCLIKEKVQTQAGEPSIVSSEVKLAIYNTAEQLMRQAASGVFV
jgi:hypothetical protein